MATPFHVDLNAQAQALLAFDRAPSTLGLYPLVRNHRGRIILTGVGTSHVAALPSWRRLVSRGRATWWIEAGRLLETPELVSPDSLLIITSRSGRCDEAVALVEKFDQINRPRAIIAITDDAAGPLAENADCEILLRSPPKERSRGFLNTLAAHDYVASMILSEDSDDVPATACVVTATTCPSMLSQVAAASAANCESRLAYIGFRDHAATALYASRLTTEVTTISAEAYVGGQFCHGPVCRADPSLTALLFGGRDHHANAASRRLAADLMAAGSTVVMVGDASIDGAVGIRSPCAHTSAQVAHGVVVAEHFVSRLTRSVLRRGSMR
jgi:fructoselysine-6-P-deglycase FrlB-like protein